MTQKLPLFSRLALGVFIGIFGINVFFPFLPLPEPPEEGGKFMGALALSGYVFPILGGLYILCSILLLLGRAVGLSLVLQAPLAINATLYHIRFEPATILGSLIWCMLLGLTAWFHHKDFADLFRKAG